MSATPTIIQAASGLNTTFASSVAATITNPVLGNSILVAAEYDAGAAGSGNIPTDTAGNKYFRLAQVNLAATFELEIFIASVSKTAASNVVTCTDTNAGVDSICCVEEWSGITGGILALNKTAGATGTSTALSSGAMATTVAPGLIWVAGVSSTNANSLVLGSGYTNLTQNHTTFSNLGIESQQNTTGGSFTGTFTGANVSWACLAVALFAANSKPNVVTRPYPFSPGSAL